jgi:ribosome biogenesis GTPase
VGKKTKEQIIATNIDTVFIVMGFDDNFNLSRLERYLLLVAASGAEPIIILNKSDLVDNPTSKTSLARSHAQGTPIISISAKSNSGLDSVARAIKPDDTVVFVGSSGVGKSTIINALLGEDRQQVAETRTSDSKGKHTTTRREMILLPAGGILIDTPGMRELGSLADNETLEASFEDIDFYSKNCKYRDCDHDKSDNCAVKTAVQVGTISQKRYQNYLRLKFESNKINKHEDDKKTLAKKTKQRQISRAIRSLHKGNYKNRRK